MAIIDCLSSICVFIILITSCFGDSSVLENDETRLIGIFNRF